MSENRQDIWGDDPEEHEAQATVEEVLAAEPEVARHWHDHSAVVPFKVVARFIGRNSRRVAITIAGFGLILAGIVLLVLPGPGWLLIFAGLAILATEYVWAARLLGLAKRKVDQARQNVADKRAARAERKQTRRASGGAASSDPPR